MDDLIKRIEVLGGDCLFHLIKQKVEVWTRDTSRHLPIRHRGTLIGYDHKFICLVDPSKPGMRTGLDNKDGIEWMPSENRMMMFPISNVSRIIPVEETKRKEGDSG